MKLYFFLITVSLSVFSSSSFGQSGYWQQQANYKMDVTLDVATNIVKGTQNIEYFNNSPDKLDRIFVHLYWNAFQPGSGMDVRSRELGELMINNRPDWDGRVRDRIQHLSPSEIGYQKVTSFKVNGVAQKTRVHGTILEVQLQTPIQPKSKATFDVVFEAQVPVQIRRSGRDNEEGVRFSMTQWYPKISQYDHKGWHADQYIAREFYGIWGNYDVTIRIDKNYKLGGTGVLQNAAQIGWGYDKPGTALKPVNTALRTWRFVASDVHDFAWAADPDYKHLTTEREGTKIHVIYKEKDAQADAAWATVLDAAYTVLPYMNKRFGKYIYPQYSFIQGGDGGMEYAMATLLKGPGLGTVFHEWAHSWYHMMLATDEIRYPWLDEGFTSWAAAEVYDFYRSEKGIPQSTALPLHHAAAYQNYFSIAQTKLAEPMTTFSDHYSTNRGYGVNVYSKGEVFLEQLAYVVGHDVRDKILLEYYKRWKLKHPGPDDFVKVAQDVSGIQLDWYKQYWIHTTKTIDYRIDSLWEENGKSVIRVRRVGEMPMPIDLQLTFKDSTTEMHHIPLDLMLGSKKAEGSQPYAVHEPWTWAERTYHVLFDRKIFDLRKVEIDPTRRMADVDQSNNQLILNW